MKHLTYTLAFLTAILIGACSDSPFNPPGEVNPPPGAKTTFGLVEVTISGIGTDNMTAQARPARSNTAFSLTKPSGSGAGDGTIQMESVSNGSFTFGSRGSGGVRYLYATFKVRNANASGAIYPTSRQNLTFLAVDTDATAAAPETYGVTAISQMRLFDGTVLTGPAAATIAEATIPTGQVAQNGFSEIISTSPDVLQVFTEAAVSAIPTPTGVTVFPYGFITRSPEVTPGSREVTTSAPGQFNGVVTFAFKLPLQSQANMDPFEITALFMPVDDSEERITQSLEDQNVEGRRQLLSRVNALNPDAVTLLPGSTYRGAGQIQCNPVRVAGTDVSPTVELFDPLPGFTTLSPDPYAADGSVDDIPSTSNFTATFAGPVTVSQPLERYLVVHGRQSGTQFVGGPYTGNGTGSIATPSGSFFAGEIVEVSRIRGFGDCTGTVVRYRVEVPASVSGVNFSATTVSVGDIPDDITAGDWDGDGDLDIAVTNLSDETLSLLTGNGTGGFTETTLLVGYNPAGITVGDWDGDGDLDLAVTIRADDTVSLLANNGSGGFVGTTVSVGDFPEDITAGDWDGDGDLDLAVTNLFDATVSVLANNGLGTFSETTVSVGVGPKCITAGDWNGDGDLDLAVTNKNDDTISLLANDGVGGYSETTVSVGDFPLEVTAGDWDGDGDLDLAVGNLNSDNVSLLTGDGAGGFTVTPLSVGGAPQAITAGDWDGDGDLDLAVACYNDDAVCLLINDGFGGFTEFFSVVDGPTGVTAGDWDGDGDLDLAVLRELDDAVVLLENN